MVGVGAAIAIVAVVAGAVVAGVAAVVSTQASADAQRDVAETNARATITAAKEAAEAQKYSAAQDATARMHESDVAFKQEMEYLKQEKWHALNESDNESYWKQTQAEVDSIDFYYSSEGSWGLGDETSYDYGYESGGGGGGPYDGAYS